MAQEHSGAHDGTVIARTAPVWERQVAVNMEMLALLEGSRRLPGSGLVRFGVDCQAVVLGFAARLALADDVHSMYAGIWRLINEALANSGASVEVFKVKAHQDPLVDRQGEALANFLGNDAADRWAKQASSDRCSIVLMNEVESRLLSNLSRARRVVSWLAEGIWPDSKVLGRAAGRSGNRVALGLRPKQLDHMWVWSGSVWRCSRCHRHSRSGRVRRSDRTCRPDTGAGVGAHPSHAVRSARLKDSTGSEFWVCTRCGGSRTGASGLRKQCVPGSSACKSRLDRIAKGRHPYSGKGILLGCGVVGGGLAGCSAGSADAGWAAGFGGSSVGFRHPGRPPDSVEGVGLPVDPSVVCVVEAACEAEGAEVEGAEVFADEEASAFGGSDSEDPFGHVFAGFG